MDVYILNESFGTEEINIIGVFSSKEMAEKEMQKYQVKEDSVWIDKHKVIE